MPAIPKSGPSLFLGIELGIDQLRASLVDDTLELAGVECVDFDLELPEYKTQGGIFTTPGEAYTTPVEMWLKGLDSLFEKLHRNEPDVDAFMTYAAIVPEYSRLETMVVKGIV